MTIGTGMDIIYKYPSKIGFMLSVVVKTIKEEHSELGPEGEEIAIESVIRNMIEVMKGRSWCHGGEIFEAGRDSNGSYIINMTCNVCGATRTIKDRYTATNSNSGPGDQHNCPEG